jgi:hypothetical protein
LKIGLNFEAKLRVNTQIILENQLRKEKKSNFKKEEKTKVHHKYFFRAATPKF